MSERTELGAFRSKCSCEACTLNCRYMPGNLIPADLERTISPGADAFAWSEKNSNSPIKELNDFSSKRHASPGENSHIRRDGRNH
jgi:hypothetical protein